MNARRSAHSTLRQHNIRIAIRGLRRTPAFTITVIVILGIGIGMSATMATVYQSILRERLPVADQARLIVPRPIDRGGVQVDPSMRDMAQLDRDSRMMRGVAAVWHYGALPSPMLYGDRSVVLQRVIVSANFFEVLGSRAALGRLLRRADGDAGAPGTLVISYDAWRRKFGGDSTVVGRQLVEGYSRVRYTIVGVAPAGLDYPSGAESWYASPPQYSAVLVQPLARLAPGATMAAARARVLLGDAALRYSARCFVDAPRRGGAAAGRRRLRRCARHPRRAWRRRRAPPRHRLRQRR